MLFLLKYQKTSSVFDYFREKTPLLLIAPNPAKSDAFRKQAHSLGVDLKVSSLFELGRSCLQEEGLELTKKSSLILRLWLISQKNSFPKTFQGFKNAYRVATELQGITLDLGILEDLLKEIQYRWPLFLLRHMDEQKILHENIMYEKMKNDPSERDSTHPSFRAFWGFSHLTGNQLDLIEEWSHHWEVFLPVHEKLFELPWVQWIKTGAELVELDEGPFDQKIISHQVNPSLLPYCLEKKEKVLFWSEKSLNYLGEKNKDQENIFLEETSFIEEKLKKKCPLTSQKALEFIQSKIDLEKGDRMIKVQGTYLETLQELIDLVGTSFPLGTEDLRMIQEKVSLDLPRVFRLKNIHPSHQTQTLDEPLLASNQHHPFTVVITSREALSASIHLFEKELLPELSSLAPLKDPESDHLMRMAILEELSQTKQGVELFIDKTLKEKTSLFDSLFSSPIELKDPDLPPLPPPQLRIKAPLVDRKETPSSLQSYLDCPLKYALTYREGLRDFQSLQGELQAYELGEIAHQMMERFFTKGNKDIDDLLSSYKKNYFYPYQEKEYRQKLLEIGQRSFPELEKLKHLPGHTAQFEKEVQDSSLTGRIDFLFTYEDESMVLDFKKSKTSIPIQKDVIEGGNIQVTSYIKMLQDHHVTVWGYFCLEKPEESILFSLPSSSLKETLSEIGFLSFKKQTISLERLFSQIDSTLSEIKQETSFLPLPRNNKVCSYCSARKICPRGNFDS